MNPKKIALFLILTLIIVSGFSCTKSANNAPAKPVKLTVWGVYEEDGNLQTLFNAFKKIHPSVSFEYRKFEIGEYEKQLVDAWVEDRGPDIYFLPNNWIGAYINRITPKPDTVKLPYQQVKSTGIGSFQKTDIYNFTRQEDTISINDINKNFPSVVSDDVIIKDKVYGLPLSLETMAMFYNKKLLDNANIPTPPESWEEFTGDVKRITLLDDKKEKFIQSGTALGATKNITNSADILMLLMQQNGVNVAENKKFISFGENDQIKNKALAAIQFYTDFANPIKEVYSWSDNEENSLDAFINGKVGFYFGYPYNIPQIEKNNLDYGITKMPQIDPMLQPTNFADYWVMTVSHKTNNIDLAWGFIDFATKKENVKMYLDKTKKPTALRSLIESQKKDPIISPFAQQILSAKSWYRGTRSDLAEKYIKAMIETFRTQTLDIGKQRALLQSTATKINQDIK